MASTDTPADIARGTEVAAKTETPFEAAIDAANGLRGHGGRPPTLEDFADVLSPGSGGITGSDVSEEPFLFGEDGSLGGTGL